MKHLVLSVSEPSSNGCTSVPPVYIDPWAILAYGDAASFCLEHYHVLNNNEGMKLGLLIAYYPSRIPDPQGKFPSSIQALVHLAGQEVGIVKHSQMVGIQGKRRVVQRNIDPGIGAGKINKLAYPSYTYNAQPGFAEHDLEEYEKISAELAWSRSLAVARRAFHRYINMEMMVDENIQGRVPSPGRVCHLALYSPRIAQENSSAEMHRPSCPATRRTKRPTSHTSLR